jgi:hypothetical protein
MNYVPEAARFVALAFLHEGNPKRGLTEQQLIKACARQRAAGLHEFNLGTNSNLRNRLQRNCAQAKIWKEEWRHKGYRPIFERIDDSHPKHWRVNDQYADELRWELGHGPQEPRLL